MAELKRKFKNQKGPWLYKGKQVNMRLLGDWMIGQNNKRGYKLGDPRRLHLTRNVTAQDIEDFLKDWPNGLKEIN